MQAAQRIKLDGVLPAYHNPHCARVQPAQLARGLADVVERLGRRHLRADARHRDPPPGGSARALGPSRAGRAARHRGLHRLAAGTATTLAADEQLDDRDRADPRTTCGRRSAGRAARPSATPRTASSTRSAPSTTASRSAGAACRTASARAPTSTGEVARAHHRASDRGPALGAAADPRRADRPRLVRRAGRAAGLVGGVTLRQDDGFGLGRRIRRARRHRDQSRRPHPGRPGAAVSRHRSPSCRGSATGRATGSPSRCGGWACAACISAYKLADWHESRGRATTSPIAVVADRIAGRP